MFQPCHPGGAGAEPASPKGDEPKVDDLFGTNEMLPYTMSGKKIIYLVVSKIFYFHPYFEKIPI